MNKIDKLDKELEKAREKAAEWQAKIRELEKQKQEEENSQIVQAVRSLKLTPAQDVYKRQVFLVSTASHGGTMVANEVAAVLSPAAKKCGFKDKGYICYEAVSYTHLDVYKRQVKARIEQLSKQAQREFSGWEFDGGRVEMNREDNRLQVFFDGKPDADTRAELKSSGFRWAPSVGAWQRQLTDNAIRCLLYTSRCV